MSTHLFFTSTPFNMLTASMVAFSLPETDTKVLCLIDQPATDSVFVNAVLNWPESPFSETQIVSRKTSGYNKVRRRKEALNNIQSLLQTFKPDHIYTGNDRRIEFQFSMANNPVKARGVYIDDGTYTYLGRKTHWFNDHIVENIAKKLAYGMWWKQPESIGASAWINECIVAFPEFVVEPLKLKKLSQLPLNLGHNSFNSLSETCLQNEPSLPQILAKLDALVLFPHESVMNPNTMTKLKKWMTQLPGITAIKHHPRSAQKDINQSQDTIELPRSLPIEVLLPLLSNRCRVVGDLSTALLTTKWLRPDLDVSACLINNTDQHWRSLLKALNITTI